MENIVKYPKISITFYDQDDNLFCKSYNTPVPRKGDFVHKDNQWYLVEKVYFDYYEEYRESVFVEIRCRKCTSNYVHSEDVK